MRRVSTAIKLLCVLLIAAGGTSGTTDHVYSSSDEADGPPHAMLDLSAEADLGLGGDGSVELALPFEFGWYEDSWDAATISADGALLFSGDASAPACPDGADDWSGVAAFWDDLDAGEVRAGTVGRYPNRAFAVEWLSPHATAGGELRAQVWLLEASGEVVIALDDVTFSDASGDASADGGASAIIGVKGGTDAGVPWACAGGLDDERSAWFGELGARPDAPSRSASALDAWTGTDTRQYAARSLGGGRVNDDELGDLIIGNQDDDVAWLVLGGSDRAGGTTADADVVIAGSAGSDLSAAIAVGDVDGDGLGDIALGAPSDGTGGASAGAVYVVDAAGIGADLSLPDDADLALVGAEASADAGAAVVVADLDGDGYGEVAAGAPKDDSGGADAGVVWVWSGSASPWSGVEDLSTGAALVGVSARDRAGWSLAAGDLDGDAAFELVVGVPYATSSGGSEAGQVYVVGGGSLGASADLGSASQLVVEGEQAADHLGVGLGTGDLDGDGAGDLMLGAPLVDGATSNGGRLYVFYGASALSGTVSAASADASVDGADASANAGSAVVAWDANADGVEDLAIAVPNDGSAAAGGGLVALFTSAPTGALTTDSADHVLKGDSTAGALGTALAVLGDHQGDGYEDLAVGEPYASTETITGAGLAAIWSLTPSFQDVDEDGFVSVEAGGVDCDDGDAAINPTAEESAGNLADDDCDGWVDDALIYRAEEDGWTWDLAEELGEVAVTSYDFEDAAEGDDCGDLYAGTDLSFDAAGNCVASASVWGSPPAGSYALRVTSGTRANTLLLSFAEGVDAIAFQVLDGADPLLLSLAADGAALIEGYAFEASGDNRRGGVFAGFTFAESVTELQIELESTDGWGLDDLQIVWASDTDRDGDGYTDLEGDCDDGDATINPDAAEALGDGEDNDCDGVIDGGGASALYDETLWIAAVDEPLDEVDFEDLGPGEDASEAYSSLGVGFSSPLTVVSEVDGVAPREAQAGEVNGETVVLQFDEVQPAVGLWALASAGALDVQGSADGVDLYAFSVDVEGEGVDEGVFVGLVFDYGVTELVLSASDAGDTWGLDDVQFVTLGLDDADGDGWTEREGDCDDADVSAYPGGAETWYDGVDGDCAGDDDYDSDGDGASSADWGGLDCDDGDEATGPDAEEIWYDGFDSDCGGDSDYDVDADGHDDRAYGGDDCDDSDAATSPDADETWYDGVDSDCAGDNDYDADGDGAVNADYAIEGSSETADCDDGDSGVNPDADETWYDGVDSDCDGESDADADGDGHDALLAGGDDCDDEDALTFPGSSYEVCYDGDDSDCAGDSDYDCDLDGYDTVASGGADCDDEDPLVYPGAEDAPRDGVDGDCDGALEFDDDGDGYDGVEDGGDDCDDADADVNPGAAEVWYDGVDGDCAGDDDADADGDGYAAEIAGGPDCDDEDGAVFPGAVDYWYDGTDQDCDGTSDYDADGDGYASSWYLGDDCDDTDDGVSPSATEVWYDGEDSDCDGASDDDADQDGHDALAQGGDDCDDADADVSPSADELPADGVDQDCDGIDDVDADGDGVLSADDCDDEDATSYPGATEICYDGVDQDCGALSDVDCDGDGYDGAEAGGDDCDDADSAAHPGASERWYDGEDRDCAGGDDYDADEDGYAASAWGGADCDDADSGRNPGVATDDCGRGDEDCDDAVDEDCAATDDSGEPDDSGDSGSSGGSGGSGSSGGDSGDSDDSGDSGGGSSGGTGSSGGSGAGGSDTADPLPDDQPTPVVVQPSGKDGGCGGGCGGAAAAWLLVPIAGWLSGRSARRARSRS